MKRSAEMRIGPRIMAIGSLMISLKQNILLEPNDTIVDP
jgi:hypothetical protein